MSLYSDDKHAAMNREMALENRRLGQPRENGSRRRGLREYNLERARQESDEKYRRAARLHQR